MSSRLIVVSSVTCTILYTVLNEIAAFVFKMIFIRAVSDRDLRVPLLTPPSSLTNTARSPTSANSPLAIIPCGVGDSSGRLGIINTSESTGQFFGQLLHLESVAVGRHVNETWVVVV